MAGLKGVTLSNWISLFLTVSAVVIFIIFTVIIVYVKMTDQNNDVIFMLAAQAGSVFTMVYASYFNGRHRNKIDEQSKQIDELRSHVEKLKKG